MTTIVFIAGLEHSGTTLLDVAVGGAMGTAALGEVSSFIDSEKRKVFLSRFGHFADSNLCSCGAVHDECVLWSPVVQYIYDNPHSDLLSRYKTVIESVERLFGHQIMISDSSKSISAMKTVLRVSQERPDIQLKVLLAVKDARSFVSSITRARKLNLRGQASCFRWWRGGNKEFIEFLSDSGIPYHIVLYEALCLRTRKTIKGIREFLHMDNVDYTGSLNLKRAFENAHICVGNADAVFRNRDELLYDCRWFNQTSINALYSLLRGPRHMNEELLSKHLNI